MTGTRWQPGDQIFKRSVWGGKIAAAWPMKFIEDSLDQLVLYLASGSPCSLRVFDMIELCVCLLSPGRSPTDYSHPYLSKRDLRPGMRRRTM